MKGKERGVAGVQLFGWINSFIIWKDCLCSFLMFSKEKGAWLKMVFLINVWCEFLPFLTRQVSMEWGQGEVMIKFCLWNNFVIYHWMYDSSAWCMVWSLDYNFFLSVLLLILVFSLIYISSKKHCCVVSCWVIFYIS